MRVLGESRGRRAWLLVLAALVSLAATQGSAAAAPLGDGDELWRSGGTGTGAGQLRLPLGVASDPVTGHVFVIERQNDRVSEFTPWGGFVKAFGWDVAPGAVNEQQEVRVRASEGEFKLEFGADATADLPFDASGAEVEAALNGLASISGGGGSVSVNSVEGNPDGTTPYVHVIVFKGSLAGTNVAQLVAEEATTPLGGGVPASELEVRTRADGHAATTGLEACTAESGCQVGVEGSGAGQLAEARGVAVDPAGNVFLREVDNRRVQKFDHAGRFLLMFGGEVNKTAVQLREEQEANSEPVTVTEAEENLCTAPSGDLCGIGVAGTGDGEFGTSSSPGIALSAGGKLFVGDVGRIQIFSLQGEWEDSVPVFEGKTVHYLALAPGSGDFYATVGSSGGANENVRILDAVSGNEKGKLQARELKDKNGFPVPATKATAGPLAVDVASGDVFARRNNLSLGDEETALPLLQFDSAGNQLAEFGETLPAGTISGFGTNAAGDLHVVSEFAGILIAFGPPPLRFESPPPAPPEISAQFATSVQRDGATVVAEINPHFSLSTTYYVQYGTGKCSGGGCPLQQPLAPGALLTTKTIDAAVRASTVLEGLVPGTTYHYRFVAESGGGGPIYGIDPDGEGPEEASPEKGLEATFITPDPIAIPPCPNDVFRGGGAARLPNCRAYEMVSPVDKNNGDIKTLLNQQDYPTRLGQSAEDGSRLTYSSYRSFADPKAAPFTNQLLATRDPLAGWSSEAIDPSQGPAASDVLGVLGNNFKLFSADLCLGWVVVAPEPQLDPLHDTPNYPNVYRRDNCEPGKESYAALVPMKPTLPRILFYPEPQGASAGGEATVFRINDSLTPNAASGVWQTYYATPGAATAEEALHLVCVLPEGNPSPGNCSAGTGGEDSALEQPRLGRMANVAGAISADGSRVYWTDSAAQQTGAGRVYLRINPAEPQSEFSAPETCSEPEKACTLKVSETKTPEDSRFLLATPEGSRALFEVTEGPLRGDLYEFRLGASTRLVAKDTLGLAGASEDLSRIYFVSEEALAGAAVAGEPNLYLGEGSKETFIATLTARDAVIPPGVEEAIPSVTARKPLYHAAQASADGSALAFISSASLTGYDNTDQETGEILSEIYLYEAGAAGPVCVSCNPSRARPQGRVVKVRANDPDELAMAATLPLPTTMLHFPRAISADGSRLFFNSFDPLLPRDTNGATDLYMWEAAPDKAACAALGAELYVADAAGCISLISTGESPEDSEFLDASLDGNDAFFITNASLLPQDPGLFDVYDARALGGFPVPEDPAPDCQGETCKPPVSAPSDPSPASSTYAGPGDLNEKAKKKAKKKNAKGKKHKKKKKQAKGKRGAAR
jgi:DNA-binding beta-propeller fold protein YncE